MRNIPFAIWETLYAPLIATVFAYVIGLPLGILLVTGEEGGSNTHMGDEFLAEDSLGVAVEIYRSLMKKL